MKKIAAVCLLALMIVVPTFAYDGTLGVSVGPAFDWWTFSVSGTDNTAKYNENDLAIMVNGDTNLGNGGLAVAYSLNITVPLSAYQDGRKIDLDGNTSFPPSIGASAGVAYKYNLTRQFFLRGGLGIGYSYGWVRTSIGSVSTRVTQNSVNAFVDLSGGYNFGNFSANLGVRGTYVFYTGVTTRTNNIIVEDTGTIRKTGFALTPYLGATYNF